MLGFDLDMLARARAHEERVLQSLRDRGESESASPPMQRDRVQENAGGGGAGPTWKICKITGFTSGNTALRCRDVDSTGTPIGTAFTVYVWSVSEQTTQIGLLDLTQSDRNYAVGMFVRVWSQQMPFVLGTTLITGWVAVHDALEVCTG